MKLQRGCFQRDEAGQATLVSPHAKGFPAPCYAKLFATLILLDSPILSPLKARGLQMIKRFDIADRVTPARNTLNRRQHWANEAEAIRDMAATLLGGKGHL